MRYDKPVEAAMTHRFSPLLAFFLLVAVALSASAQGLYKWVDKDGRVTYSDTPPPKDARNVQNKRLGNNVIEADTIPYALKQVVAASPITLYATDCDPCKTARAYLTKRGVPFTEKNPETDPEAMKFMKDSLKSETVPTLTVGSGATKGYSEEAWAEALDAAGYPKSIPRVISRQFEQKPAKPAVPTPTAPDGTKAAADAAKPAADAAKK